MCNLNKRQQKMRLLRRDGLGGENARRWVAWKKKPLQSHPIRAQCLVPELQTSTTRQQGMGTDYLRNAGKAMDPGSRARGPQDRACEKRVVRDMSGQTCVNR